MSKYSRAELDREARVIARRYRKEQDPETNYRASRAKVEYWEISISQDFSTPTQIQFIVHLDNGAWLTQAI